MYEFKITMAKPIGSEKIEDGEVYWATLLSNTAHTEYEHVTSVRAKTFISLLICCHRLDS